MRTGKVYVNTIADGPIQLIEDRLGRVIGNSQALAMDLREAIEILEHHANSVNDVQAENARCLAKRFVNGVE